MNFDESFWSNKYLNNKTGWDLGEVSPPISNYFDSVTNKELKILIPGAGNSYEAEYLFNKGFRNVFVVDITKEPLQNIKNRIPDFPDENLIHKNFFDIQSKFDVIVEQTFFCALDPKLRTEYATKMESLLNDDGKLIGLLFDKELNIDHPPFGGSKEAYIDLFSPHFYLKTIETAYNSVPSRMGMELFIQFEKKTS